MQLNMTGSAPAPVDLNNINWSGGQTVQTAAENWFNNPVATSADQQTQAAFYVDQSQNQPIPIASQEPSQFVHTDQSHIASNYTQQQNYDQYPTASASVTPDLPAFNLPGAQAVDGGFPVHQHLEAPQHTAHFEPNYAAAPPHSYIETASAGPETQMHVAPPDHTADVASVGMTGAAIAAAANAHYSASPPPAPEPHVAPPAKSGSALGNLLAGATGHKLPALPPQQANHEAEAPAHQQAKVSEGGLAGAILNRGKKNKKDAHQQALNDAGQMPGQEDA
jgi:hypothetical protein